MKPCVKEVHRTEKGKFDKRGLKRLTPPGVTMGGKNVLS